MSTMAHVYVLEYVLDTATSQPQVVPTQQHQQEPSVRAGNLHTYSARTMVLGSTMVHVYVRAYERTSQCTCVLRKLKL